MLIEMSPEDYTVLLFLLNKEINEFTRSQILGVQKYVGQCMSARARLMRSSRRQEELKEVRELQ